MNARNTRRVLLGLIALLTVVAATAVVAATQGTDDFVGVYRYDVGRGPEEITVTKIGEHAYRLEIVNTTTQVSRWEQFAYYRDGHLVGAVIDRPGNNARIFQVWRGRTLRPGVVEVQGMPVPGDPNYTPTSTWSPQLLTLTKIR